MSKTLHTPTHPRILIATPLFPPDIDTPAEYVKELATRLSIINPVTILLYGNIPEYIPDVQCIVIKKHWPAVLRLAWYTLTLIRQSFLHDRILIQNGPSTELPTLIASLLVRRKMILSNSDSKVIYTGWRAFVHQQLINRVSGTISPSDTNFPLEKPEILPFNPPPTIALAQYEQNWSEHLALLSTHI